ncbi:MAG TPA: hypothetical protein VNG51_19295 [Ktedonobacteraceae bacterium]|nr:hypothetical protein [Ktedonobacteraceae bacterium]
MGGDDSLIRHLRWFLTIVGMALVFMLFAFGLIELIPHSKQAETCTISYHTILSNRFFKINEPLLPRRCK